MKTPETDKFVEDHPWCKREPELIKLAKHLEGRLNLLRMSPVERCQLYNIQDCHICPDFNCEDNMNPLKRLRPALEYACSRCGINSAATCDKCAVSHILKGQI